MLSVWRGKGFWVWALFVIWSIVGSFGIIWLTEALTSGTSKSAAEVTGVSANTLVDWCFAMISSMTALSIYLMDRYRRKHPQRTVDSRSRQITITPHVDEFIGIPMGIWPYILLALTQLFIGLAYFGISIGN